jgi:transcriptional regulator with XRE-family HTH domain
MIIDINKFSKDIEQMIKSPIKAEGGKVFVNRLVHLFGLRSKVELSELIGVSTGAIATWQTRNSLSYELVMRIHLATGISVEYLLFDELKGDLNVMQYLPDPTLQPNYANIKHNISKFRYSLTSPAHYDGGAVVIERLVTLFQSESKVDLADLFGINVGTLGTWHTRKTTPHELLCRIHLATGVSMHYLCFGKEWEDVVAARKNADLSPSVGSANLQQSSEAKVKSRVDHIIPKDIADQPSYDNMMVQVPTFDITSGNMKAIDPYFFSYNVLDSFGMSWQSTHIVINDGKTSFIDTNISTVTKGLYLFSVNNLYQIGELRQLPDGKQYLIEGEERFPIDTSITKIAGKVVSVLKKT